MPYRAELEALNRPQCLRLLQTVHLGRLVFTEGALPAVQPVNFRMHHNHVVIRIAGGGKLAAATDHSIVAFQADQLDPDLHAGWTVTVVGHAELINDIHELVDISGDWLQPWVTGNRGNFVRIRTEQVTGRRLHPPIDRENGLASA
jgi:nitroimidazol reductase NimA-like FMN-containing flavoprotein (pyridoxamine 5'-phosphate oxidase superfamily)